MLSLILIIWVNGVRCLRPVADCILQRCSPQSTPYNVMLMLLLLRNGISVSSWNWRACNYRGSDPMWLVRLPHRRLCYSFHLVFQAPCSKEAGHTESGWVLQTTALADVLASGHKQWAVWVEKHRRWLQYPELSGCMKNKFREGDLPLELSKSWELWELIIVKWSLFA